MFVFNVDGWLVCFSDLIDYGREEIGCLIKWFWLILERVGCDIIVI